MKVTSKLRSRMILCISTVGILLCYGSLDAQTNWPQFRGAQSRGISSEINLPSKWSDTGVT